MTELVLWLDNVCCRLKAAEAKLVDAVKSVAEEMEQYVQWLLIDN